MSLEELYSWTRYIGQIFEGLKVWQIKVIALYSYRIVVARQCAPGRVAEKLGLRQT